jgi:hypothetical protein
LKAASDRMGGPVPPMFWFQNWSRYAQCADPVRVELIDSPVAVRPVDHETRVLEHPEVLGDGRPADTQVAGEQADRARTRGDRLEDRPPRRVVQRGECGGCVGHG